MELADALSRIDDFRGHGLGSKLDTIQRDFEGCTIVTAAPLYPKYQIDTTLLEAAIDIKDAARRIDEVIHAVGILESLPSILQVDEVIESLSLGAGSTGKPFDLTTSLRVAEFTFIDWKGGPETVRQNRLFKAFLDLAEYDTQKKRCLYVQGSSIPLEFLNGGRSLESVLSSLKLWSVFQEKYGTRLTRVREYYSYRKDTVEIIDLSELPKK